MEKIKFMSEEMNEEVDFYVLEQTKVGGVSYILVTDSEDDDAECLILKDTSGENQSESVYEIVEDDVELSAVLKVFEELLEDVEIETPIEKCMTPMISGRKLAVVPILRAGLGMVSGILALVPTAKVGHIGLFRDPETLEPVEYYCKLPADCEEREVFVVDPMLATGGSCIAAIQMLKNRGVKNIRFMCIIAAPEGVKKLQEAHPDVEVYIGALDEKLNEHGYIVPGLGDAGDRIFGTK